MTELTRRRTILGAMSAGTAALAGCLVEDDADDNSTAGDDGADDRDDTDDSDDSNDDGTNASISDTTLVHQ
jgi:hypothetical protein